MKQTLQTKIAYLIFFYLLLIFLALAFIFLLVEPAVWPDEAIYSDIVINLIQKNHLGSTLWKELIPGVETHIFWNPPLFFYELFLPIKLSVGNIYWQRFFSVTTGFCFLIIYYALINRFLETKNRLLSLIPVILLIFDITFMKASRVSRPEIYVLFWGMLSLYLFHKTLNTEKKSQNLLIIIGSGFFSAMAFLNHFLGAFFLLTILAYLLFTKRLEILRFKPFYLFSVSFLLPISIWLTSLLPNLSLFMEQLTLAAQRKQLETQWLTTVFTLQPFPLILLYLFYLTTTIIFIIFNLKTSSSCKKKEYLLITLCLIFSWVFAIFGKQFWYFVFPLPFIYLALNVLLNHLPKPSRNLIICVITALILLDHLWLHSITINSVVNKSYEQFTKIVVNNIPEGKTVFLSSIPDPYFGLKRSGKNYTLHEFPVLATSLSNYQKILNNSDYIVYTNSYEQVIFEDFLNRYIEQNQKEIKKIGEESGYLALIIELKPKSERKDVNGNP